MSAIGTLHGATAQASTKPTVAHVVSPYPRVSNGIIHANSDFVGGEPLQSAMCGSMAKLNANLLPAEFTVTAGGPTGKQIVIPASWHGGDVVYVRGAYATGANAAVFGWDHFMADIYSGDATNYLDATVATSNTLSAGVLSTAVPIKAAVATGTVLQLFYGYRDGTVTARWDPVNGWPVVHKPVTQTSANDGDNYLMAALYHAYKTTSDLKYKLLADRIGSELLAAETAPGLKLTFSVPPDEETSSLGMYKYSDPVTTLTLTAGARPDAIPGNSLHAVVRVDMGGPPYKYAGWGTYAKLSITPLTPFASLNTSIMGDGSGRKIVLITNISPTNAASGNRQVLIPLLPSAAGVFKPLVVTPSMLWDTSNAIYDSAHIDFVYTSAYGNVGATTVISEVEDTTLGALVKQFTFNFNAASGYAGFAFNAAVATSAGTTALNLSFYSDFAGTVSFSATDSAGVTYTCTPTIAVGWQNISIPWVGAVGVGFSQNTFTHPATGFKIDVRRISGVHRISSIVYDTPKTMAQDALTVINGFQFQFPANALGTPYDVHFASLYVDMAVVDGPTSDVTRYQGIPRWVYQWRRNSNGYIGYGAWRGPSAPGYSWISGWHFSGLAAPNNRTVAASMLNFMTDAQNAYKAQFPAQLAGPLMPMYGRTSFEAVTTPGFVSGVWVGNTDNQWYYPTQDNWFGYTYRAVLAVARHYYYTRSTQAKAILDTWMTWMDAKLIADGAYWWPPSEFNTNGTLGYTYRPLYAYATLASICTLKYWVDGDAVALKWYRRMLDDMYARHRQTATGFLGGVYPTAEGSGYTTASVTFAITGTGAVMPQVTPVIAGGKIVRYSVVSAGWGLTSCVATVTGDGTGAQPTAYMSDRLVGAFSGTPIGWEQSEVFNAYALIVNGPPAGGTASFTLQPTANDTAAFVGLHDFYTRNASKTRPSMLTESMLPMHEFSLADYHANSGIENPCVPSTHVKGVSWTETMAPTLHMAVEWGRYSGDYSWLRMMYRLASESAGQK